nr:LysR substrate-binding domain-containing protein [Sneathiella litorea]
MNHAQLKAFHAVAKTGGFSTAAKFLGLTQPAITLQVRALEKSYNTKLFKRRGRKTEMTPSGKILFNLSKRIFGLEEEAHTILSSLNSIENGQLSIVATSSIFSLPLISVFQRKHPNVHLSFATLQGHQIEPEVLKYRAEIAIQHTPPEDNRLFGLKLGETPLKVAVSKEHPLSKKKTISLKDLTDQMLIVPFDLDMSRNIRKPWSTLVKRNDNLILTLQNKEIGREAVANNLGISVLSEKEILWDERIQGIEIEDTVYSEATYIVCLAEERKSPLVALFFESITKTNNQ